MRRAVQRASTFHSTLEPPNEISNLIPQNDSSNKGSKSSRPESKSTQRNLKTQRRAATNHPTSHPPRQITTESSAFPSILSAPQLAGNDLIRVKTQIHLSELLPKISNLWSKPLLETPVPADFHRLASRITILDHRHVLDGKSPELFSKEGKPKDLAAYILIQLSQILEEKTQAEEFKTIIENSKNSDMEIRSWMEYILKSAGETSRTVALCKTVSQSIISPVASQIKIIFAVTFGLIKDASTSPEGWKIFLEFYEDCIICSHLRKETSMALEGGNPYFDFQWKLDIKFSKNLDKIESVQLGVIGPNCHEAMPVEQKQKLIELLAQLVVVE